jgi:hypothetical protein
MVRHLNVGAVARSITIYIRIICNRETPSTPEQGYGIIAKLIHVSMVDSKNDGLPAEKKHKFVQFGFVEVYQLRLSRFSFFLFSISCLLNLEYSCMHFRNILFLKLILK